MISRYGPKQPSFIGDRSVNQRAQDNRCARRLGDRTRGVEIARANMVTGCRCDARTPAERVRAVDAVMAIVFTHRASVHYG